MFTKGMFTKGAFVNDCFYRNLHSKYHESMILWVIFPTFKLFRYAKHFQISWKWPPNLTFDEISKTTKLLNQWSTINTFRCPSFWNGSHLQWLFPPGENDPILINRRTRWRENATPARVRGGQFPLSLPPPLYYLADYNVVSPGWVGKPDLLCQADSRDEL